MDALNDGTTSPPRLRLDFHLQSALALPRRAGGPRARPLFTGPSAYRKIREAGYEGVQIEAPLFGSARQCRSAGLRATTQGMVGKLSLLDVKLESVVPRWKDEGIECATLLVGTGQESDDEADRLMERVLEAANVHRFPLFVETHRATVTNDPWRTLRLVERHPELRFNGDFSHWYLCSRMGDEHFDEHVEALQPIFRRVRFLHGRLASSGCIQIDSTRASSGRALARFRTLWTHAFRGFLRGARPGDLLCFVPELLPPWQGYAQVFERDGRLVELGNRWEEARFLCEVARDCFDAARESHAGAGEAVPAVSPPTGPHARTATVTDSTASASPARRHPERESAPRLRTYLHVDTLLGNPPAVPVARLLETERYDGLQADDAAGLRRYGELASRSLILRARIVDVAEIDRCRNEWEQLGVDAVSVRLGKSLLSDDATDALVRALLAAGERVGAPIYLEISRGTLTQDPWRTVQLVGRFPELRFWGDFAEWYAGHEMLFGRVGRTMDFLGPVLERTSALTCRIGTSECTQIDPRMASAWPLAADVPRMIVRWAVRHFRGMWTQSMSSHLARGVEVPFVIAVRLPPAAVEQAHAYELEGRLVDAASGPLFARAVRDIADECFSRALASTAHRGRPQYRLP